MAMMTTVEKILAKAQEFEEKARALRLAASVLNGHVHEHKLEQLAATLQGAKKVRRQALAQANGGAPAAPEPAPRLSKFKRQLVKRAHKRDVVLGIIRAYGRPMPLAELTAAARAQGIRSLTGMVAYVRAGFLKISGKRGKTRYTFVTMPPDEAGEAGEAGDSATS